MFGYTIKIHWPVTIVSTWKSKAIASAKAGRMIEAIRTIKDAKGWSLKETKEYYDKHIRKYYKQV